MEPVSLVVNKIKGLVQSGQELIDGFLHGCDDSARRNPIQILKRLQRESFSDLMKLRDRQDKIERMLSFYKTSKSSPFQESSTRVMGEVDVLGAILLLGNVDQQHYDAVDRAGIKTGIKSKFTFETTIREKDTLLAELVASTRDGDEVSGSALSLSKVLYEANISDWFSAIAIPVGAQSRDIGITRNSSNLRKGLTDLSSFVPPLLNQHNGSTIGVTVRKSNVIASMAQSVSGLVLQPFSDAIGHCFSTFGHIACQLPGGIKFSLLGLHQVPKLLRHHVKFGSFTIPLVKRRRAPEATFEASAPLIETESLQMVSTGSIAINLEKELDENTKIKGWIEMKNSNPKHLQWAVNVFDDSEDESGWGICVSGLTEDTCNFARLQTESYLKLNLGTKFSLKPGIAYAIDGDTKIFALMLRSDWCF